MAIQCTYIDPNSSISITNAYVVISSYIVFPITTITIHVDIYISSTAYNNHNFPLFRLVHTAPFSTGTTVGNIYTFLLAQPMYISAILVP